MNKALTFLTGHQREIYELHERGMTFTQIAESKGCTPSAVRQTYNRAVQCLREYERYQEIMSRNLDILSLELSRGELKYVYTGLQRLQQEKRALAYARQNGDDGLLACEYGIITTIMEKVGKVMCPDEEEE